MAKASLSELQGDLEDYLVRNGRIPWSIHDPNHRELMSINLDPFERTDDLLHDYWTYLLGQKEKFAPWLGSGDDVAAANALIVLIQRAVGLLGRQLNHLEQEFAEKGGIRERMYGARVKAQTDDGSPNCPDCGKPMRKRASARGEFWGCSTYPDCRGIRQLDEARS